MVKQFINILVWDLEDGKSKKVYINYREGLNKKEKIISLLNEPFPYKILQFKNILHLDIGYFPQASQSVGQSSGKILNAKYFSQD